MKSKKLLLLIMLFASCKGLQQPSTLGTKIETGIASWYGPGFHGKQTANGEIFNTNHLTAAHRTLPFNTYVRVINQSNGNSVVVRINDRGPYAKDRILDLSMAAAKKLGMIEKGTASVALFVSLEASENLAITDLKKPSFTIQVGSLSDRKAAMKIVNKYADGWIGTASVKGKVVYRIYRGKFTSEAAAKARLASLPGNTGFVKQIEN